MNTENEETNVYDGNASLDENGQHGDSTIGFTIALLIHDVHNDTYMFPQISRIGSQTVEHVLPSRRFPSGVGKSHQEYADDMVTELFIEHKGNDCYIDASATRLGTYQVPTKAGIGGIEVYTIDVSVLDDSGEIVSVNQSALQASLHHMMMEYGLISQEGHDGLYIQSCDLYYAQCIPSELIQRVARDEIARSANLSQNTLDDVLDDAMVTLKVMDGRNIRASKILWKYMPDTMRKTLSQFCTEQESNAIRQKVMDLIDA
jgi:hypothetical protein